MTRAKFPAGKSDTVGKKYTSFFCTFLFHKGNFYRREAAFRNAAVVRRSTPATGTNKKALLSKDKSVFLNDVFRYAERSGVMCPSDVMCATRVKVTLAEHITSLLPKAKTSLRT